MKVSPKVFEVLRRLKPVMSEARYDIYLPVESIETATTFDVVEPDSNVKVLPKLDEIKTIFLAQYTTYCPLEEHAILRPGKNRG